MPALPNHSQTTWLASRRVSRGQTGRRRVCVKIVISRRPRRAACIGRRPAELYPGRGAEQDRRTCHSCVSGRGAGRRSRSSPSSASLVPALWIAYQARRASSVPGRSPRRSISAGDWALRLILDHAGDHPGARILALSQADLWRAARSASPRRAMRVVHLLALCSRPEARPVQGGDRDRAAHLPHDRLHGARRADRARRRPRPIAPSAGSARRAGTRCTASSTSSRCSRRCTSSCSPSSTSTSPC